MKIGLVSDSHGNIENLRRAYREAKDKHHCELFFHVGDDYQDIHKAGITDTEKVFRVPGVFHPKYQTKELEARLVQEIEGYKILVTHSKLKHKNDPDGILDPEDAAAKGEYDLIFFGHTHVPDISVNEKGVI